MTTEQNAVWPGNKTKSSLSVGDNKTKSSLCTLLTKLLEKAKFLAFFAFFQKHSKTRIQPTEWGQDPEIDLFQPPL